MATSASAAPPAAGPGPGKRAERLFYSGYVLAIALVIVVGFVPSFYLRGVVEPRAPLGPLRPDIVVHGVISTAFLLVLPLQAWLIASGRRALHVKLGNWGFALGVLFLASLYAVSAFSHHNTPADLPVPPELLSAPSVLAVICAAVLLWLAWRHRFDAQAHKRLIIGLACIAAGPGIARLPGIPPPPAAFVVVGFVLIAMTLPLLAWDFATRGRPHWATLTDTAVCVILLLMTIAVGVFPALTVFVKVLPGFGWP